MRSRNAGYVNGHGGNPVIEIMPEMSDVNFLMKFAIGGAYHSYFHFLVFLRPNSAELAVLQQLQ